ncbi:kelch-like protein 18, partial [Leptotrombidium deliense]
MEDEESVCGDSSSGDDCFVFTQEDLPTISFPVFDELRKAEKLVDIRLKVGDKEFSAHRVVLASTIPYFHAMFTHDMLESSKAVIEIQESIEGYAFESLIDYAYSGQLRITSLSVQSLMVAASFLQLQRVCEACCEFLKNRLHVSNVLGVQAFADTLGCISLVESAKKFVQKQFEEVAKSEEFLSLNFNEITEIISKDELNVSAEEKVFEAVMTWVKKDEQNRKEYLPNLLTHVRLPLLTPQYLTDYVATEQLIRNSHSCRDLLDEAKDYHLMPERRHLLQSFRTRPRCCSDLSGLI